MKAEKLCSSSLTHLEVYRPIERNVFIFQLKTRWLKEELINESSMYTAMFFL